MNKKSRNTEYVENINRPYKGEKRIAISLFSGLLGLDIGLERAGFHTVYAMDYDKDCKNFFDANTDNFKDLIYEQADITKLDANEILRKIGAKSGEVDLLAGGPPCQPFSKSGLRKGTLDDKGLLFKRYLDYLGVIQPKAFILENVRGIFSSNKGDDFRTITKDFEDSGYTIYWKIMDAANYGVPQFRQRLFLIGFRDRLNYSFPIESHGEQDENTLINTFDPFVTVEDAISDLNGKVEGKALTGRYAHLVKDIPEGINYSFYTERRGHPNPQFKWRSKFWYFLLKADRSKPSLTIQAYPGNNTGPFHWDNRKYDVKEIARIQSLPDNLKLPKSYQVAHKLIGNAVPAILGEKIGKTVMNALDRNEIVSNAQYLANKGGMSNNGKVKSGRGTGASSR